MILYGLRHRQTKKPLGVEVKVIRGDSYFEYNTDGSFGPIWLVDSMEIITDVLKYKTIGDGSFYNPDFPSYFLPDEWEIFQIEI